MKCSDCAFWIKDTNEDADASCRRFPPTPFLQKAVNQLTQQVGVVVTPYWPRTRGELWCGEFKAKTTIEVMS